MAPTVEILSDQSALISRAYDLTVECLQQAIAARGRATLALSGGSTPKPLYTAMTQADLPWSKLYIFWGDERYVPHDHEQSNARMSRESWLNHVPIPESNIFPMPTSAGDPAIDAATYEATLQKFFQTQPNEFPAIDFVLQGMGDDGHTASLFPHTEALEVCDRLVTVGNHDGEPRLTFTIPLIKQGRKIIFLVAGKNKQSALTQVFADHADGRTYPSKLIQSANPHWLLDAAAGQAIPTRYQTTP